MIMPRNAYTVQWFPCHWYVIALALRTYSKTSHVQLQRGTLYCLLPATQSFHTLRYI